MVEIRRMGPQIGVEVTGVDVRTLDDAGFAPIYQAWLDHNVMVVRDQELTIEEFLRYSRRFGLVVPHPSKSTRHPQIPEITLLGINKFDADGNLNLAIYRRGAEGWHTDGAYNQQPFKATQLYALAVPSRGGDTFFANGYAAYEALPQRLKQRLDPRSQTVDPKENGLDADGFGWFGARSVKPSAGIPIPKGHFRKIEVLLNPPNVFSCFVGKEYIRCDCD